MIDSKVCNCGGTYVNKKGKWVCDSCGRPMPQILDSRENQLLAVAEGKFAQEKFIEAEELYVDIVKSFPDCYPAYWGLTLAKHGIKYVDDLRTGKKVATCWAPEISSIKDDKNYKKVLDIASQDERKYYEEQGAVIENIRKEWQEKAKKIKPYDIFICFKDTDDETRGRTEDSIELSDLYNNLTRDKYNVFFSRYSLEGITAENYEPYIFQALSTAKVMIVYGSKEEYFESTWMKNEWTRFLHKIADGQKQKNALLPVVKGCSPNALPPRLRALQVLDAGKNTFYSDLTRYIDKVLASSEEVVELKRSKIKFDKRQSVDRNQSRKIQSRALQVEEVEVVSAQGEQLMKVINSFVNQKQYERAEKFCDAWIKSNPNNYRDLEILVQTMLKADRVALAGKYVAYLVDNAPERKKPQLWSLMIADGYTDVNKWADKCIKKEHINYDYMQNVLATISQNDIAVLYAYYDGLVALNTFDEEVKNMILYVLEIEADVNRKNTFLNALVQRSIDFAIYDFAYFDFVISLLDNQKYKSALASYVDNYADRNKYSADEPQYLSALQNILPLTENKVYYKAQRALIQILFDMGDYVNAVDETQQLLGYTGEDENEYNRLLDDMIEYAIKSIDSENIESADEQIFRLLGFLKEGDGETYYFGELAEICLKAKYKKGAERYAKLLLGGDREDKYDGYYYLMLLSLDCYSDEDVARLTVDVADTEGYNNWLANCDEEQISRATDYLNAIDLLKVDQGKRRDAEIKKQKEAKAQKNVETRAKVLAISLTLLGVVSLVFSILSLISLVKSPSQYSARYSLITMVAVMLVLPTLSCTIVGIVLLTRKNDIEIKDKTLGSKAKKVLALALIIPLLIVNVLVFTLDTGRYKYVDGVFWVKDGLDGKQTLYEVDTENWSGGDDDMLVIPSSVNKISATVFASRYIVNIFIPKSVTEIESEAFYGCSKLKIYCEATSEPRGFASHWNAYKYSYRCSTYWGSHIQFNDNGLNYEIVDGKAVVRKQTADISGDIVIPSQVEFGGDTYDVTGITDEAFAGYGSITSVTINADITSISDSAFANCSALTSVTLPSSVTGIGYRAFYDCPILTDINIPSSVTQIGEEAFAGCSRLENITLPSSLTSIGDSAFNRCNSLREIVLPNSVTDMGDSTFAECSELRRVTLPSGITSIGERVFESCSKLISIDIPDGVTSIGDFAFSSCGNMVKAYIPDSVTVMQNRVFDDCNKLIIYCEHEYEPITWHGQWNPYNCQVVWDCKNNVEADYGNIFYIDSNGIKYSLADGQATVVQAQSESLVGDIVILSQITLDGEVYAVTEIECEAFYHCFDMTSVFIPDSVTVVEWSAFDGEITIYCEAESQPEGWYEYWCDQACNVVWGSQAR